MSVEIDTGLKRMHCMKLLGQDIVIKISHVYFRISTESSLQGDWTAALMIKSNREELWLP